MCGYTHTMHVLHAQYIWLHLNINNVMSIQLNNMFWKYKKCKSLKQQQNRNVSLKIVQ